MRFFHFLRAVGKAFVACGCNLVLFNPVRGSGNCLQGNAQGASTACHALSSAYPDQLYFPNTTDYTAEAHAIWSQEAWKTPACVFSPFTPQILASGLQVLVSRGIDFAIRSGGHMPVAGHNSFGSGGIMIATTHFTDLETVSTPNTFNASYVRAGAAFRWESLYRYLESQDLLCVGGRDYSIGSALLLGGGMSYFSGIRGWAANNIVNYEIVLANSSIFQVNNMTAPDLFWALKGGSNNFGIVTRYDLMTFPTGPVYGGSVDWASGDTQRYLDAQTAFIVPGGGSEDRKAAIMPNFGYSPTTRQNSSGIVLLYDDPVKPKAFENFTSIPPVSGSLGNTTLVGIVNTTAFYAPRNKRWVWASIAVLSTEKTMNMIYNVVVNAADHHLSGVNCTVGSAIQPVTKNHLEAAQNLGGDAIDLDPAKGNFVIALIYAEYFEASKDGVVKEFLDASTANLEKDAKANDIYYPWLFLNDAGIEQDPIATYGYGSSRAKMAAIAKKYDPLGVFQKNVPGYKLTGEVHAC
ncbi:MAG: hypothetical protein Q9161_009354 [Pseudevernia consocians]